MAEVNKGDQCIPADSEQLEKLSFLSVEGTWAWASGALACFLHVLVMVSELVQHVTCSPLIPQCMQCSSSVKVISN